MIKKSFVFRHLPLDFSYLCLKDSLMKRFVLASFILLTFISLSAQNKLKNSSVENIKNSGLYFCAEGLATDKVDINKLI